jgi:hypothetical protein
MTDAQPTTILKPRAISKRAVFDIICGVLLIVVCAWGLWIGPIWPDRIGIIVGLVPPLFLMLQRAQNRQFHPDRLPARWSKTSRLEMRVTTLLWVVQAIFFFFMMPWIFVDTSKHPVLNHVCLLIAVSAQVWAQFLDHYIADRKYIPPPDPLVPPSMPDHRSEALPLQAMGPKRLTRLIK